MKLASFLGLPTVHFLIANTYSTSCKQSKARLWESLHGNEGKLQTVLVWITFSTTKDLVTLQIFNTKYSSPKLYCQAICRGRQLPFMFWSICTQESIYCSSEKFFLDNTAVWYTPIQCSCLNTCAYNYSNTKSCEESSNPFVHVWYYDLLCGAWTMGLVRRGLFAISYLNTDGEVSFILLSCWLGVSRKNFNLCEHCILKSVDLWTLVFAVCHCTKLG